MNVKFYTEFSSTLQFNYTLLHSELFVFNIIVIFIYICFIENNNNKKPHINMSWIQIGCVVLPILLWKTPTGNNSN